MRMVAKYKIAVDAMLEIAAHTNKGYAISLPAISKRIGFSLSYLEPIFTQLKAAGLIQSHRGPGGGYSLARKEVVSVKDIVNAIGDFQIESVGPGAILLASLEERMQHHMSQITLDHLLAKTAIQTDPSLEKMKRKLLVAQQQNHLRKMTVKIQVCEKRRSPGPNSVFSFGQFLLKK